MPAFSVPEAGQRPCLQSISCQRYKCGDSQFIIKIRVSNVRECPFVCAGYTKFAVVCDVSALQQMKNRMMV